MPRYDIEVKQQIISLHNENKSLFEISATLNIPKTSCFNVIQNFKSRGHLANEKSPGRPRKLTEKEEKKLITLSINHPKKSSTELLQHLKPENTCSTSLVRKTLLNYGLHARVAFRKPLLTQSHRHFRKKFASEFVLKPTTFWKNVIFSDETIIELSPNRRILVRRPLKSGIEEKYLCKTKKFGGKKLMLWGFISSDGRKGLAKVSGNMNAVSYVQILQENLLPNMYLGEIFQQDNAPVHTATLTKTWMLENAVESLENWPAQSPDLNIIEHVWSFLKKKVSKMNPKTVDELWHTCEEEFRKIPQDFIETLYESIPRRLNEVLRRNGKNTKY